MSELIIGMGDPNGHIGRNIDGCQGFHGVFIIGKGNHEGRMLLEFCEARHYYHWKDPCDICGRKTMLNAVLWKLDTRKMCKD